MVFFRIEVFVYGVEECAGEAFDGGERGAELVAGHGDEGALHFVEVFLLGDVVEDGDEPEDASVFVTDLGPLDLVDAEVAVEFDFDFDGVGFVADDPGAEEGLELVVLEGFGVGFADGFSFDAEDGPAGVVDLGDFAFGGDEDESAGEAFEGLEEFFSFFEDGFIELEVGDDGADVPGHSFEEPDVLVVEVFSVAFVERVEDADGRAFDDAVLVVSFFDDEGDGDPVGDVEERDEVFSGAVVGDGVMEDGGDTFSEDFSADSLGGSDPEVVKLFFFDPVGGRDGHEFAGLVLVEHDHDFFGLEDHGDPLDEPSEGDVAFLDGCDFHSSFDGGCFWLAGFAFGGRLGSEGGVFGLQSSALFCELLQLSLEVFRLVGTHGVRAHRVGPGGDSVESHTSREDTLVGVCGRFLGPGEEAGFFRCPKVGFWGDSGARAGVYTRQAHVGLS